jgi:branched-chain amino acid transport system permease protein
MGQYTVNALALGGVYALFTLGLSLCWGVLNILNLAQGALFMAGALTAYEIANAASLPFVGALVAGVVASAVLAGAFELLVFRALRRRARNVHEAELAILISTIALAAAVVAVGLVRTGGLATAYPEDFFRVTPHHVAGVVFTDVQVLIAVCAVLMTVGVVMFVKWTNTGRAIRAVAHDRPTAALMGIDADRLSLGVVSFSAGLAGLAGVLYGARLGFVDAAMGDSLLFKAFVVIVLAGVGSVGWAFVGAVALALIETFVTAYASANVENLVVFGIIMLFLAVRPQGIAGRRVQRV